jgi:DNA-binding NtrC family response regulator
VRELRNLTERAVILCDTGTINIDHFPNINDSGSAATPNVDFHTEIFDLEEIEKRTILKALEKVDYNKSAAAELLNIKWNALHRRLQKFNIVLPE